MTTPHNPEGGPVVVRVANCQSVSAGPIKSAGIFRTALTQAGPFGVPDVVLACECADFDAMLIADDEDWAVVQYGVTAGVTAKMGSVAAWRNGEVDGYRLTLGSEAGEGINARYVVQVDLEVNGHRETFTAGHAPPDRAPNAQAEWLANVDEWPGIIGADFNTWPKTLADRYARQVRGVEVLSLLIPQNIPCSLARGVDIGSDHQAVDVQLWNDKKENR